MHLYIITRGIKHHVDNFITQLQGKYMPFKWRAKDGEDLRDTIIQMSVRPIQLWELVFPEECQDEVLATILKDGKGGKTQHRRHDKFIWGLRKALGVEKIPEYKTDKVMPLALEHVEVVGIGTKKDYWVRRDGTKTDKKEPDAFEGL